ncbi:glycosyltransferase family 2 protein [Olleya sp. 1-3]|uniref:glycosyltransferase family 2 protein n=1 Tax=Olleya sp. 1-3 TaxID=2058323 RepID=UPI000C3441AF|nr:glycosyltransferase family A protein [Olleya sp. 1-3]PKG51716.1 glycosyltransferase family 2 protein [Olleya sp. 1-3]
MCKNLISIIVPCYNQGEFLSTTLQSVINQSYSEWECILINDGSTDNTAGIIAHYVEKDKRFISQTNLNSGVSASRNSGLNLAQGDYIQFLDADDYLLPTKLEDSLNLLKEDDKLDIVISNFRMFKDSINNTLDPFCDLTTIEFNLNTFIFEWNYSFSLPMHFAMLRTELFNNVRFPEHMTAQEDWMVWVSIFKQNPKVFFLNKELILYRLHPNSRTQSHDIIEDQIKALILLKELIPANKYNDFSIVTTERNLNKIHDLNIKYNTIKHSNAYKIGCKIEAGLNKIGLLKLSQKLITKHFKK